MLDKKEFSSTTRRAGTCRYGVALNIPYIDEDVRKFVMRPATMEVGLCQ